MLRVLCFSDLHRDREAASRLVEHAKRVDLVVGAGDFANRRVGAEDTLEILRRIDRPAVLVCGNGESETELAEAARTWPSASVLHGQTKSLAIESATLTLYGLGGGIPVTPFGDWSYDLGEDQAASMLADAPERAFWVTHSPPLDTVDHDRSGRIRGSRAIREAMMDKSPRVLVCGHIHSDWGKHVRVADTLVVNAGPTGVILQRDDQDQWNLLTESTDGSAV